jgi:hypothetical protein
MEGISKEQANLVSALCMIALVGGYYFWLWQSERASRRRMEKLFAPFEARLLTAEWSEVKDDAAQVEDLPDRADTPAELPGAE